MSTVKLRATLTVVYDADTEHYETPNPAEMAKTDQENLTASPADLLYYGAMTITVEPVKE